MRASRNAPCPCGSGKKYKHCCLQKDREAGPGKGLEQYEDLLRARILRFMSQKRFKPDAKRAAGIWTESYQGELPDNELDAIRFGDWLMHDYRLAGSGKTLIELFGEEERRLAEEERALLEGRLNSRLGLYEVTGVEPGRGVRLRELHTGEECFVHDVSASKTLVRWDVALARVLAAGDRFRMEGAALYVSRARKDELVELGEELFERYRRSSPRASWKQFMKDQGYMLNSCGARARKRLENIKILTFEGDEVVISRAVFKIREVDRVVARLERVEGIEREEVIRDRRGRTKQAYFKWICRAVSRPAPENPDSLTFVYSTTLVGSGIARSIVSLGDIDAERSRLVLECMSRKRLERGRALLERHLGDMIEYMDSSFTDPRDLRGEGRGSGGKERAAESDREATMAKVQEFLDLYYRDWVDTPLPSLGGKTPRQASKTRKNRMQLEELLKDLENSEERRRKSGEPAYDVRKIRRVLGSGWARDEPIDPCRFASAEGEKTKLNWFCYELALSVHGRLVGELGERLRGRGVSDDGIAELCVGIARRLGEEIARKLSQGSVKMRLTHRMVASCIPGVKDDSLISELLDAVHDSWEEMIDHCQNCPTACLDEWDRHCTMFDEGPF